MSNIKDYLEKCTNGVPSECADGTGLTAVHRAIFNHKKNLKKDEATKDLTAFYSDPLNILEMWDNLAPYEKDFVGVFVQYGGIEYLPTTLEFAKTHGISTELKKSYYHWGSAADRFRYTKLVFLHLLKNHNPTTKAVLLFPSGKDMPPFVLEVLKTVVAPMKFEYHEYKPCADDFVICREGRIGDFAALVRLAGSEKLKVKPWTYDLTRPKLVKFVQIAGFEEVGDLDGRFCTPKEVKRNSDFRVSSKIFALGAAAGLVDVDFYSKGDVSPGNKSLKLLSLPSHELAKTLFECYINRNNIFEMQHVTYVTTYDGDANIEWHKVRKPIIDLLKNCPVNAFVRFEEYNKYAKILCANYFRKHVRCAIMVKGFDFGYRNYGSYDPDWDECESRLIRVILSFLSAIGMVDIAYCENIPRINYDGNDFCVGISGFRLTNLGAWILGIADEYNAPAVALPQNDEGAFAVLPDHSVIIAGLKPRIEHESYLSKFLTKVSIDENSSVYKLDFQSAVRALDIGITPKNIRTYLQKAVSVPLADNIIRSLDDWQAKVNRVKIRNVTILETDNPVLLEELKHIRGMGSIVYKDLPHAVEISPSEKKRAKTLIEKNGWLVRLNE